MKIIVSEIPEEGMEIDLSEDLRSESVKIVSPVRAALRVDKKGPEVLIHGMVSGEVELQCGRCLRAYTVKIESPVNVVYRPVAEVNREEHYELKSDELDAGFYRDDAIELDDLLIEQLMLDLPMKALCSPDCKGICPKCGADLNATQCNCDFSEIDPRLKVLEKLLKRKE